MPPKPRRSGRVKLVTGHRSATGGGRTNAGKSGPRYESPYSKYRKKLERAEVKARRYDFRLFLRANLSDIERQAKEILKKHPKNPKQ